MAAALAGVSGSDWLSSLSETRARMSFSASWRAEHVGDADALVIEATFLDRDSAMARDYGHLTATKAAELAATSNVKQLVLTHISGRYPDVEILAEATRIFPNSRVAADFDHIVI
jgi:ribonuclease Z